jgi:hypothetical protein
MIIQTRQEHADATDRLRKRDTEALATFIASLAMYDGPIGEQVCTFIVGDDLRATGIDLERRIKSLREPAPRSRHGFGREVSERLMFVLDAIEMLVLPKDSQRAFDLLVLVIQSDGDAMENCGDHHFEVSCAIERAIELIARVMLALSRDVVQAPLRALAESDGYGTRSKLKGMVS